MVKNARMVIGFGVLGMVAALILGGWLTGFFARVAAVVSGVWEGFIAWVTSPFSFEHALAALGVLAIPLIILIVIFALTEN